MRICWKSSTAAGRWCFSPTALKTYLQDNQYPERQVAALYSKRDLEKLFNLRRMRQPLTDIQVDKNIAGRYYQEGAIKAVCHAFDTKNRRKALLVMATGSGKTRTAVALCKVLLERGWVKNILFLADRTSLVTQAKRSLSTFCQICPSPISVKKKTTPPPTVCFPPTRRCWVVSIR